MADDWLTSAVDGISLDNGLDASAGADSPSLTNNISQLLRSTRRDRADLEARLQQLRGFIQQTDEVMRGIMESGDPTLAAKYTHLAGTRRSLEQNAAHLQDLLHKVTESEARATQLAERGRQLTDQDVNGDVGAEMAESEPAARGATGGVFEWPEPEQKVAVVRGRPGHGTRRRDAGDGAAQDWAGPPAPPQSHRGRQRAAAPPDDGGDEQPSSLGGAGGGVPMDRLLRALRGGDGRPPASPGGSSLGGAEMALRDKAAELDATRRKLQHLRRLMSAVQEVRGSGAGVSADAAPAELRALIGEVQNALETTEDEGLVAPERGRAVDRHCSDCRGGANNGMRALLPPGEPRQPSRPLDRMSPNGELPPQMAPLSSRRANAIHPAPTVRSAQERDPSSLPAAVSNGGITPGRDSNQSVSGDDDVRAQLQHVSALVQSLLRPHWPPQPHPSAPVWPLYSPHAPPAGFHGAGWPLPTSTEAQHQQTLSALGQVFQLLQTQQQQIQTIQRQLQTAQSGPLPAAFAAPLLRVDDAPPIQLPDGYPPPPPTVGASMLNNQVAPGSRANNYWDNFRSYSRQNLLSGGSEPEAERPRAESESFDDARAEGFMARPRTKKQKVNKENQQLERSLSNSMSNTSRPTASAAVAPVEPVRPRAHRASTPHNNPQVDAIYSCVTTLIAQNQEQPEFLIELLHDLQLVRSERQRQQVLLAVQSVVVQEVSGVRHKQRNRATAAVSGAAASAAVAPAAAAAAHHSMVTAEREEAKTSHHHVLSSKHMKNWSHSQQRPETAQADVTAADPEDTVTRNLAPLKNAAIKNTAKPSPLEPASAGPPLEDPELQVARALHEMNVFLADHQAALLSPVLLARLERLLLRTFGQPRSGPPPPGLNRLLEEAMVPFMGQPVSEAGGRLVQAVLERLGATLRGRELLASPPAAAPFPAHQPPMDATFSCSEDDEEPARAAERAERTDTPGQLDMTDEGPQVIPEQEVPCVNGREPAEMAERSVGAGAGGAPTAAGAAVCRPMQQTPCDTPEPVPELLIADTAEAADLDA